LKIDGDCAEAAALLQETLTAEQKQRQEEISGLLAQSRAALQRGNFDEAAEFARRVSELDEKNKDAKSLAKTIEKSRRAAEKAARKEKHAAPGPQPVVSADATWIMPDRPKNQSFGKLLLWACLGLLVLGAVSGTIYFFRSRPKPADVSAQLAAAQTALEQQKYDSAIETVQQILSISPRCGGGCNPRPSAEKQEPDPDRNPVDGSADATGPKPARGGRADDPENP